MSEESRLPNKQVEQGGTGLNISSEKKLKDEVMATAITINELEWRSDAVQASAGRIISVLARRSLLHLEVLLRLQYCVNSNMDKLLSYLHSPESIRALEDAPSDKLVELGRKMKHVHGRVRCAIAQINSVDLGIMRPIYKRVLDRLEDYNAELETHADAFCSTDSLPLLLSKQDQDFVLACMANPREPNEALRRAVARK